MERFSTIRTRRWTRSPRGEFLGVATGLAEWRGFPPATTRLIVFLCILFTGFFPGLVCYLIAAVLIPMQSPSDVISERDWREESNRYYKNHHRDYEDASFTEARASEEKSTEELRKEYENLKKKVEEMEGQMFDREKDWDARFNGENR